MAWSRRDSTAKLRDRGIEVELAYREVLRNYNGDASRLEAVRPDLARLLDEGSDADQSADLSPSQKRVAVGLAVALTFCLGGACLGGAILMRNALKRPAYVVVVTASPGPAATPTTTPTVTPAPTATTTPAATVAPAPAATATPAATAAAAAAPAQPPTATQTSGPAPSAQLIVTANLRAGPGLSAPVLEQVAAGSTYTVLGRDVTGGWLQICCTTRGDAGWLAAALATISGSMESVPVVTGE